MIIPLHLLVSNENSLLTGNALPVSNEFSLLTNKSNGIIITYQ